jgi:hypothetical protein
VSIRVGIGISKNHEPKQAGYEACKRAIDKAGGEADITIVFCSVLYDQQEVIRGVREASNHAVLAGCSNATSITNDGPIKEAVSVMAIKSDSIDFSVGIGRDISNGNREAGQRVAREVKDKASGDLRSFVMFPDILAGNGAEVVRGVLDVVGENFPVVGGAASDNFKFEKTFQFLNDEVSSDSVVGVGLSGAFSMGSGVRHGWVPVGVPMKVTKSDGAIIHTIDNKPALNIYKDYFGDLSLELQEEPLASMALTYPLGIKVPDLEEYLIRSPITVVENGSITTAAEIPEGSEIRLMVGSKEKAIEAAQDAARKLMKDFEESNKKPSFVLMFNCIAREKLFGSEAKSEIDAVLEIIGNDIPLFGFYTYGEQAPLGGEIHNLAKCFPKFYNETIVMFAVGE